MHVRVDERENVWTVVNDRPEARSAVDLIDFAERQAQHSATAQEMREFAEARLSWTAKIQKLIAFVETVL